MLTSAAHLLKFNNTGKISVAPEQGRHTNSWSVPYLKLKTNSQLGSRHFWLKNWQDVNHKQVPTSGRQPASYFWDDYAEKRLKKDLQIKRILSNLGLKPAIGMYLKRHLKYYIHTFKATVFAVVMYRWELAHKEGWVPMHWCLQIVVLEKALESPLDSKEIKPVNLKENQPWILIGSTNAEAPILWPSEVKSQLSGKDPEAGKIEGNRRRGRQRMRWLDSITNSMDMNLSKLQKWRTEEPDML